MPKIRLLGVYNGAFVTFLDEDRLSRVIVTHRWIVGNEAKYRNVREKRSVESLGVKKGEAFCDFVRRRSEYLKARRRSEKEVERSMMCWLWIEACCINRDSETKLSTAINSMFKWYAHSAEWIAYLQDVLRGCWEEKRLC